MPAVSSRLRVGLALAAPIPPLAFLDREARVARLSDNSVEGVENARVLAVAGEPLEARVHFGGILSGKLADGTDAEQVEVPEHSGADGDKVVEEAWRLRVSLFVRHRVKSYS